MYRSCGVEDDDERIRHHQMCSDNHACIVAKEILPSA
jgi:hypothetical protein